MKTCVVRAACVLLLSGGSMLSGCTTPPPAAPADPRSAPVAAAKQVAPDASGADHSVSSAATSPRSQRDQPASGGASQEASAPGVARGSRADSPRPTSRPRAGVGARAGARAGASVAGREAELAAIETSIGRLHAELDELVQRYTRRHPEIFLRKKELRALQRRRKQLVDGLSRDTGAAVAAVSRDGRARGKRETRSLAWTPKLLQLGATHYLPDFSYAGYRWGETPLPNAAGTEFRVTDFGAVADDGKDDTKAIHQALEAAHRHRGAAIVSFPSGRFIVSDLIRIKRGNLVLKGAGGRTKNGTLLAFPKPLLAVDLPAWLDAMRKQPGSGQLFNSGRSVSLVSSIGGFIWVERENRQKTRVLAHAAGGKQGSHRVTLAAGSDVGAQLRPGTVVDLGWCRRGCDKPAFLKHVFDGQAVPIGSGVKNNRNRALVSQAVTVVRVDGDVLTLKEPLLHDIRPDWQVGVSSVDYMKQVGIEGLRIVFPKTQYKGHFKEAGYNGIYLRDLLHSWVKDVGIVNADNGVIMRSCKNVTLDGIAIAGRGGHYAVKMVNSNDLLISNFSITAPFIHSPTVSTGAKRIVYTKGVIHEARLDQHNGLNQQNLFDNLTVKMGNIGRLFDHGGAGTKQPTAGAFTTFWNIVVDFERHSELTVSDAPSARLVALRGSKPIRVKYGPNAYVEGLGRSGISVPSLYEYQLNARRHGQ